MRLRALRLRSLELGREHADVQRSALQLAATYLLAAHDAAAAGKAHASARLSPEELVAAIDKWAALEPTQLPYSTTADLDPPQIRFRQQQQPPLQSALIAATIVASSDYSPPPIHQDMRVEEGMIATHIPTALPEEGEPPEDTAARLIGGAE